MAGTTILVLLVAVIAGAVGAEIGHRDAKRLRTKILEAKRLAHLKREIELEDK